MVVGGTVDGGVVVWDLEGPFDCLASPRWNEEEKRLVARVPACVSSGVLDGYDRYDAAAVRGHRAGVVGLVVGGGGEHWSVLSGDEAGHVVSWAIRVLGGFEDGEDGEEEEEEEEGKAESEVGAMIRLEMVAERQPSSVEAAGDWKDGALERKDPPKEGGIGSGICAFAGYSQGPLFFTRVFAPTTLESPPSTLTGMTTARVQPTRLEATLETPALRCIVTRPDEPRIVLGGDVAGKLHAFVVGAFSPPKSSEDPIDTIPSHHRPVRTWSLTSSSATSPKHSAIDFIVWPAPNICITANRQGTITVWNLLSKKNPVRQATVDPDILGSDGLASISASFRHGNTLTIVGSNGVATLPIPEKAQKDANNRQALHHIIATG